MKIPRGKQICKMCTKCFISIDDLIVHMNEKHKDTPTLKSLIEEHARLDISDFLSTLLAIFHVINKKLQPARLLTYLVKSRQGVIFPTLLFY